MKKLVVPVLALVGTFWASSAHSYEFNADDNKALVVFMGKPQPQDFRLSAANVDLETKLLKLGKGFNLIVGKGTALFGPYTRTYAGETEEKLFVEHKKLKPGSYIFTTGFSWAGGHNVGCFGTKLFTIEAGKSYIMPLSDGVMLKNQGNEISWKLDPNLPNSSLKKIYDAYVQTEGHNVSTDTSVISLQNVSVDTKLKGSNCHFDKKVPYTPSSDP